MTSNESAYQPTKSLWRVTPENPVRHHDRLGYERCAALHNELLELGWTGSGRSLDDLETNTWFEIWGQEAEDCRVLLSDDLTAFLERAQIPKQMMNIRFSFTCTALHLRSDYGTPLTGDLKNQKNIAILRFYWQILDQAILTGLPLIRKRTGLSCKCQFMTRP